MAVTWQFVDSIASSPTVLLDLNDKSPIKVASWDAPPPPKNRSSSSSSAHDGTVVAQESFGDREITLTVNIHSTSQDTSATAIQALARLLNAGQWLKFNPGTTNPVFFRTKPAEIDQLNDFNFAADGFRTATLTIPAEPFAYGLPETGTATVANDPTAGTNPMSYVFPTVKGDVATPIQVSLASSTISRFLLATSHSADTPTVPLFTGITLNTPSTGWTQVDTTTDSTAIGGTCTTLTKASGVLSTSILFSISASPYLPAGDYRLLLRVKNSTAAATVATEVYSEAAIESGQTALPTSGDWRYLDLGVFRFPGQPPASPLPGMFSSTSLAGLIYTNFRIAGSTGSIRVDGILPVPAGLDSGQSDSLMLSGEDAVVAALPYAIRVDSLSESSAKIASGTTYTPIPVAGGFPTVVPGTTNVLTLVRSVVTVADVKTDSVVASWSYYPRYLYVRPATT